MISDLSILRMSLSQGRPASSDGARAEQAMKVRGAIEAWFVAFARKSRIIVFVIFRY